MLNDFLTLVFQRKVIDIYSGTTIIVEMPSNHKLSFRQKTQLVIYGYAVTIML